MVVWQFWIDVGGTFTDCLAHRDHGQWLRAKVLSSARTPGVASPADRWTLADPWRQEPAGFWTGYRVEIQLEPNGAPFVSHVADSQPGRLRLTTELPQPVGDHLRYELCSDEEAPLLAVRLVLGLPRAAPIPPCLMRLGTTRGTNALLTRRGAPTALVTTRGFADVLEIGYQDRPKLFELTIRKPPPLYCRVVEVDERIDATGQVLHALNLCQVEQLLDDLLAQGIQSLAIALLNAYANPIHEQQIAALARQRPFCEVSVSSELAPLIKLVPRADTTVLNAYLNPILRDYLTRIRQSLGPESQLLVVTSAGGLCRSEFFQAKDSILSGPAGGVIGYVRVAESLGLQRVIGFDMGGTSTDVSRWDGQFELQYESQKAGVRVMAPTLAIETVAAGGGSICSFDGVKLTVGPDSAGADPGPACYGRGGPLTITDLNVFLGRIPAERFPFPLDRKQVVDRLRRLADDVARQSGKPYSLEELASGLLWIANTHMAQALQSVSISRGYDPRHYVLAAFGGAAGQHACAVADQLGISRILFHPDAGLLSALGAGLADMTAHAAQGVYRPYTEVAANLAALFAPLQQQAIENLVQQAAAADAISVRRSLDLRFQGLDAPLTIYESATSDYAALYRQQFERVFGYLPTDKPIEVAAARVEAIAPSAVRLPHSQPAPKQKRPQPKQTTPVYFDGTWMEAGLWDRNQLEPGDVLTGPCIVSEPYATIVLFPGWQAEVYSNGELVATRVEVPGDRVGELAGRLAEGSSPDPIALEVFHHQFARIAEQMGITLRQTASSVNVKERLDFSCAVFSKTGDLVANAPHIPVHLGAMSQTIKHIVRRHPEMRAGDIYVTNDPYCGGSHLPDVTVVTPVFFEGESRPAFFTASRAHHAEIGGLTPGSMPPNSTSLVEEGVVISDFLLARDGQFRWQQLRELLSSGPYPSRQVETNLADIAAQVAANNLGATQLRQLAQQFGRSVVDNYMTFIQQAAETKMRAALRRLPEGTRHFVDHLDDGSAIAVAITIRDGEALIDFTGTSPVLPNNLNANPAIVTAAIIYVFRCLLDEDIPLNQGMLAPIKCILPECLLNPPANDDPARAAAVAGGNVETSQRVVDVLLGALELAAASQGTMNNFCFGDSLFGYYETICGGAGATRHGPGVSAVHTHMTNTRLTDVEVLEHRYPVRVQQFTIRRGSGGAGRHVGGDGVVRRIEFLRPLQVSIVSQRRTRFPPFGLHGGQPGAFGENIWIRRDGTQQKLPGIVQLNVQPGDVVVIATPGGGGWGTAVPPAHSPGHHEPG